MPERRGGERPRRIADCQGKLESPEVKREARTLRKTLVPRVRKNLLDHFTKNWKGSGETLLAHALLKETEESLC
jgi:hypothetical protein